MRHHRIVWAVALLLCMLTARAQDIRQLFDDYEHQEPPKRTATANAIAKALYESEHTDSLYSFSADDPTRDFTVYCLMGWYYYDQSAYEQAIACAEKSEAHYNEHISNDEYAGLCNQISQSLMRTGNFIRALEYMKRCYEIDLKHGDKANISSSLNNLASLYLALRQPEGGLEFAEKAVAIERELKRDDKLASRLGISSELHLKLGHAQKALELAQEAWELDSQGGRHEKAAIRQTEMANAYIAMGRLDEAEEAMLQALPVLKESHNQNSEAICHNQYGQLLLKRGKYDEAINHFNEALSLSEHLGNLYLQRTAHHGLYLAMRNGNPGAAIHQLERYSELTDSMYSADLANYSSLFHSRYHADELTKSNTQLNEENIQQRKRTRYVLIISLLTIAFLVSLLAFLYYIFRVKTKANRMMKQLEEMRMDFFTKITHEYRTPLTVITGLSDNIAKGDISDSEEVRNAASLILRNGHYINTLTDQLLDLSRLRSKVVEPQWKYGDIAAYTEMIAESFRLFAKRREIAVNYRHEGDRMMNFVPDYYTKTLHNLISNSLKYTADGGHIDIHTRISGGTFTLTVTDNGEGIDPKDLPHIFEEFYLSSTHPSSIGTGVGLALVKQIANSLNGTVHVESQLGQGTTFVITAPHTADPTLPAAQYAAIVNPRREDDTASPDMQDEESTTEHQTRILVVEDNADVSQYIGMLLKPHYEVHFAKDGRQGIEIALEQVPDLILTDLLMPHSDGLQLCQQVRSTPLLSHIPVIVVTAKITDADRMKSIQAGADAYLTKPFNPDELLLRVSKLLEQRQMLREKYSEAIEEDAGKQAVETLNDTDRLFINKFEEVVHSQITKHQTDVETIASILCVSSKQLRRKIYAITGKTTAAYIQHIKLSQAKNLLLTRPDLSISDIALLCGFDDNARFSKAFKQYYQQTPSQFKKQ